MPKSYAKRRRLHLDALALAAVDYPQNAAFRFGFNDYDFDRIGRSTPDSAHLWHRFNRVENLTEKKRERVTWRSLLIASSLPLQRRHDMGRLIKGDAKFVFTNVLHRSLVNITDGFDEAALTQYGIDAVAFVDINREES